MHEGLRKLALQLETPRGQRILTALFVVVASFLTFLPVVRFLRSGTATDYRTWFDAAQAVWRGAEIYPRGDTFPFMYPPTCALLLAIPAACGKAAFILILALLNTLAWILCVTFSVRLAENSRFHATLAFLPSLILLVYIWSSYHLGQPSLVLLALILGAFICLWVHRGALGGALIALAVAIKAFPILAIFYLIYRRFWTAVISLVIALVCLLLVLPLPFRGVSQTMADLRGWQGGMLHYEANGIAQRQARGYSWKNQSIFGLANRMLRHVSADEAALPLYANIADLNFRTVNAIIAAIALMVGLSFVLVMPSIRTRETDVLEFAALLILILLFTPLAFGYLFVWLMLPLTLLISRLLTAADAIAARGLIVAIVLLAVTAFAPRRAQIYGSVFFAALALYVTIATELWRAKSLMRQRARR